MVLEDTLLDIDRANSLLKIPSISLDLVTSLCGDFLGSGTFRSVFDYNLDNKYVIKIEPRNTNCNQTEYAIWDEVRWLKGDLAWVTKWFAPIKWISPNGRILVMQKTSKKPRKEKPKKIPAFLWDVKEDNFGWIGNNYVCHDYGQFYNLIHYSKKMKKVKW